MRTRLTDLLQIEHPVMLAGMGGVSYHRLVAAVSEAGGIGTLGAAAMESEQMVEEIAAVRELTDAPFGVDLLAALPERMMSDIAHIVSGGASLFVAGLGVPRDVVARCHDGGVIVASMCGKVRHAIAAVEAGCDLVIAQGTEAGGHTGTVATMPLVPQIVDAVGDRGAGRRRRRHLRRRGLAAALALGADGVWLGTRFIATPEARAVAGYKDALLRTAEDGTVISRGFTGKTLRAVRNEWTQYVEEHPEVLRKFPSRWRWRSRTTRCTSAATRTRPSTPTASATRRDRASARSTSSFPPVSSCTGSSRRPRPCSRIASLARSDA